MISEYPETFSADECDKIIALGESNPMEYIEAGANLKRVKVGFIDYGEESDWIFGRMIPLLRAWPISRLESLQLSVYGEGGECGWHIDHEEDTHQGAARDRIVNAIVQLSEPDDYEGGALEAKLVETIIQGPRARGDVLVMDKQIWHRVAPLTKGTRKSLVCWGLK